jgi:VanZ family protein
MADAKYDNIIMTIGHRVKFGDKIGHLLLFGLLALLLNHSLAFRQVSFRQYSFLLGSVVVLAFAITEEFSQLFFSSRTFDWSDMACDVIGVRILSSSIVVKTINKWYDRQNSIHNTESDQSLSKS